MSAMFAHEHCQNFLQRNAIRAIVSSRAKQVSRLETKLQDRVIKLNKKYSGEDDILEDIVDLVGVRIALYFPNDSEKIAEIITESFDLVERKLYPESKNSTTPKQRVVSQGATISDNAPAEGSSGFQDDLTTHQRPKPDQKTFKARFGGYVADHYRVRIRRQDLITQNLQDSYDGIETMPMVEIQVASILMHGVGDNILSLYSFSRSLAKLTTNSSGQKSIMILYTNPLLQGLCQTRSFVY
jgi:ppGpp synthetase/RelA/SpoT-type nucleotidyltranferase